jgi:aldose 1-epimerase
MASERTIALHHGDVELDLIPGVGGAISRLTLRGKDVLRQTGPDAADPLETACFSLVPYSNRIAHRHFRFENEEIRLKPNSGTHPHWLHGHGWQRPWRVASAGQQSATLAFDYEPGDWPWAYSAEQTCSLTDDGVRIDLSLRNLASHAMPVSLGFHPYFLRTPSTVVRAEVTSMWETDETIIPTRRTDATSLLDLGNGARLSAAPFIDHCFPGLSGSVTIDSPERGLTIAMSASDACRFFHLYVPPERDFFCAEPVTAMPDMVNRPESPQETGMRTLAPGETFAIWMQISAREQPQ